MNRLEESALSPVKTLRRNPLPIAARPHALLAPQRRQRRVRSITLSAFMAAAVVAATLASVQVRAGQTPASGGNQSNAGRPAATSQTRQNANEIALLRKKLDALEQILVQNQKENAKLRQQVRALEAQQHRNAALSKKAAADQVAAARATMHASNGPVTSRASLADQTAATQAMLRDLQNQQALLKTRAAQAEALYRNGMTSYQDTISAQADVSLNRVRIEAAEVQLNALKAGHQPSQKEQILAELREHLAEHQAMLVAEQEGLKIAQARAKAGVISSSEQADAEAKVNLTQTAIDKLKVQILQATAR
jgi:hypothetical protein